MRHTVLHYTCLNEVGIHIFVCMCVCVYMFIWGGTCLHVCVHMHVEAMGWLLTFSSVTQHLLVQTDLTLHLRLTGSARLVGHLAQGHPCRISPALGFQLSSAAPSFVRGCWGLNSDGHHCICFVQQALYLLAFLYCLDISPHSPILSLAN